MAFRRAYFELCGMSIFGGRCVFSGFLRVRRAPGQCISRRDILASVGPRIKRIDHIQIAAPEGCEAAAREFYGAILGLAEVEKPAELRPRGGCWFQCGDQQVHIGVERDFRPAKKAHPAFVVSDLDELREALAARQIAVVDDSDTIATRRFYAEDPWGNRLEFVDRLT
jgi:catechol 2,3-dioxygenase-like lactoylglutathione lyase family enzyme